MTSLFSWIKPKAPKETPSLTINFSKLNKKRWDLQSWLDARKVEELIITGEDVKLGAPLKLYKTSQYKLADSTHLSKNMRLVFPDAENIEIEGSWGGVIEAPKAKKLSIQYAGHRLRDNHYTSIVLPQAKEVYLVNCSSLQHLSIPQAEELQGVNLGVKNLDIDARALKSYRLSTAGCPLGHFGYEASQTQRVHRALYSPNISEDGTNYSAFYSIDRKEIVCGDFCTTKDEVLTSLGISADELTLLEDNRGKRNSDDLPHQRMKLANIMNNARYVEGFHLMRDEEVFENFISFIKAVDSYEKTGLVNNNGSYTL